MQRRPRGRGADHAEARVRSLSRTRGVCALADCLADAKGRGGWFFFVCVCAWGLEKSSLHKRQQKKIADRWVYVGPFKSAVPCVCECVCVCAVVVVVVVGEGLCEYMCMCVMSV